MRVFVVCGNELSRLLIAAIKQQQAAAAAQTMQQTQLQQHQHKQQQQQQQQRLSEKTITTLHMQSGSGLYEFFLRAHHKKQSRKVKCCSYKQKLNNCFFTPLRSVQLAEQLKQN